ncbi:VCBS repeat-containing protein [Belliella marina]|uniref:VCBS repeat-containing protein n=1 Tax=Belliella marina TaxID=1644146 RepID=A0ABW4VNS3_9BACT
MLKSPTLTLLICTLLFLNGCSESIDSAESNKSDDSVQPIFELLTAEYTGVDFSNDLTEGLNTNVLMYEYFYNGGGVAVGDLNGDGLDDIYFTGNMVPNRLYLNKGNLKFEDITETSGVAGRPGPWTTGVTMVDVNGDGLLDIYVCYSGSVAPEKRKNQLFIHQGVNESGIPVFKDEAEDYGLAIDSYSTQAVFFDYDKDGDLDMFLLNHNPKSLPVLDEASTAELLKHQDPAGSQLFRNDKGKFVEVTQMAGIQNSALSYGLGVGIADLNGDGWLDIYVSNDYMAPDFLYINNGDGTFQDIIKESLGHISQFSMGNELADINNDGLIDIFTIDMLPEGNKRQKLLMAPDNYEKFDFMVSASFHHQYMRNMLHLNHGNGHYSEIGQLAGISNTDWSWAALFADFDNDGWKDLFVTNGYLRDYTNLDFLKYMGDYVQTHEGNLKRQNVLELVNKIPASDIVNYVFKNQSGISFENMTKAWGLDHVSNSNGAAYADLDNDGDLELIVNNVNLPASIFNNTSEIHLDNNYLKVALEGEGKNRFGLGAKVSIFHDGRFQMIEQMPTRGYQSSVSPVIHFGLGDSEKVDSLVIEWPKGDTQTLKSIVSNQKLTILESEAIKPISTKENDPNKLFSLVNSPFQNQQVRVTNDFKRQALLVNPLSASKTAMGMGDINGDGLDDIFIGGLAGFSAKLYLQEKSGGYKLHPQSDMFDQQKTSEDTDVLFFDANGNGHLDIYVARGGYGHFSPEDPALQDMLYLNDGLGGLIPSPAHLPKMLSSTGCVRVSDINGDGHPDLFVGGRVIPGKYPEAPRSYILINDGNGKFNDQTEQYNAALKHIGMVTDAAWTDMDGDGKEDLILVGEWMPITVFLNQGNKLVLGTENYFDKEYKGWWNTLAIQDLDGNGTPEIIVGNYGLNSQVKAKPNEPAELFYKDFDQNGSVDPILTFYIQGESYPYLTRDELLEQFTNKRAKFSSYESYSSAKIGDIFDPEEMKGAGHLVAETLETAVFKMGGDGKYRPQEIPLEAQFAPVHAIQYFQNPNTGKKYLLMAGNTETGRLRIGKIDANHGLLFQIGKNGDLKYITQNLSGLQLIGDTRNIIKEKENTFLFNIVGSGIVRYEFKD